MSARLIDRQSQPAPHGVRWLILGRLAVILLCVAVLLIRSLASASGSLGPGSVYALLLSLAILDIGYLFLLPHVGRGLQAFLLAQFLLDMAAVTGLVFLTGGLDSNFVNLYFVLIMAASMLVSRRDSALFAFLATAGLAVVTGLYVTGTGMEAVFEAYRPTGPIAAERVLRWTLSIAGAFFVVAYLSGLLAERLALARSLNEEILQNMDEGVAVFDPRGKIIFLNAEFERMFSPRRPIQLGQGVDLVFPDNADAPLRRLIAKREPARFELPEREGLTPRPPMEIRTSILGSAARPGGLVLLASDLSLYQRAQLAERRAERFSAVSEMAAGLAHEIRNPLASVRGSIQEISRDLPTGSPNHRLAQIMLKESDRLDHIITNFLQFARQRPLRPTNCRLSKLVEEVGALLASRPDGAGVEIELRVEQDPVVRCDPDQIREVFLNLGVNALAVLGNSGRLSIRCPHHNPPSPDSTSIQRRGKDAEGVAVSFIDTGPGLPPGNEDRIFEPFYTTKPHGAGLGLSIARRVVESHEGRIWVRSKSGRGAAFYVWLPLSGPFTPGAPVLGESHERGCSALAKEPATG